MSRVEEIVQEPLYVRPAASHTRGADKAQPKVTKSFRRTMSPDSSRDASSAWPSHLRHCPGTRILGGAQDDWSCGALCLNVSVVFADAGGGERNPG